MIGWVSILPQKQMWSNYFLDVCPKETSVQRYFIITLWFANNSYGSFLPHNRWSRDIFLWQPYKCVSYEVSHEANCIYFSCLIPVRIVLCMATCCCKDFFNEKLLCCDVSILVIGSMDFAVLGMINVKKMHGKLIITYLWSHQIQDALGNNAYSSMTLFHLPLTLRQEGIHNDGHPHCICCICGHSCTGSHFFGICASKSESCWMNLSSCWPTTVWFQLLLCQYQFIVACCNLFSCNGAVVLHAYWCVTYMVAITVIMIVKWHWRLDTFNGLTTLILVLGVTLGTLLLGDKDNANQW